MISNGTLPGSGRQGAAKGAAAEADRRLLGGSLGGWENIPPTVAIAERYHTYPGFSLCERVRVFTHFFIWEDKTMKQKRTFARLILALMLVLALAIPFTCVSYAEDGNAAEAVLYAAEEAVDDAVAAVTDAAEAVGEAIANHRHDLGQYSIAATENPAADFNGVADAQGGDGLVGDGSGQFHGKPIH